MMAGSGPDGVLRLAAGGVEVALWRDHTYTRNSADNVHAYARELVFADGDPHHWQAMGVRLSEAETVLESAVLLLPAGCGEPGAHTILFRPGTLYLPCAGEVVALDVHSLDVRWKTRSHLGCVFSLHELKGEEALIVHGEITVARVEPDGRVSWEQAGRDIFTGDLRITGDVVEVTDWNGDLYRFRITDGEVLAGPPPPPPPPPPPSQPSASWLHRFQALLRP